MKLPGQAATHTEGYRRALALLHACSCEHGFLASPSKTTNYRRVWARDGVILGLAGLLNGDSELVHTFRRTLQTLADNQGPHGEIPSNVDPASGRVSYGGTTGRVDSELWFVIGCGEFWQATGDDAFVNAVQPALNRVKFLLGAWEFNNRGLIYVPETGDWADEFLHHGYVLYDQLLYLQAQRTLCAIRHALYDSQDHQLTEKTIRLKHLIHDNYWFNDSADLPDDAYHDVLYEQGRTAASKRRGEYWMPFFSPTGYGFRFDALANVLVSLFGVCSAEQRRKVDAYIDTILVDELPLLPAFHPVIDPHDKDWSHLHMTFSYSFKNRPHEFQNGGLWPFITGFYVADLAARGETGRAGRFLDAIDRANALPVRGEPWSFPEYVHGQALTAGGTPHQGWSAAGAVIAHHAMQGERVFRIGART